MPMRAALAPLAAIGPHDLAQQAGRQAPKDRVPGAGCSFITDAYRARSLLSFALLLHLAIAAKVEAEVVSFLFVVKAMMVWLQKGVRRLNPCGAVTREQRGIGGRLVMRPPMTALSVSSGLP